METGDEQSEKKGAVVNEDPEQENDGSTESDSESSELETVDVSDSGEETDENDNKNDNSELETVEVADDSAEEADENDDDNKENGSFVTKRMASKKFTGNGNRSIQQIRNFGTKKQLRQRPNRNAAIESAVIPDSEDDISCEDSDS